MPIVFSYATLEVMSRAAFNNGLIPFFTQTTGGGSSNVINIREIFAGGNFGQGGRLVDNLGTSIGQNLQANAMRAIFSLVGIAVAKKAVSKLGVNRSINKLSDSIGTGQLVRAN